MSENKDNKLHQINASYSKEEDRILLRTSTTQNMEYRVWLTRRYTHLLMGILSKEIDQRGGTTELVQKKQTKNMLQAGAFEKPFQEKPSPELPLGEDGVLAYSLKTAKNQQGNLILEIQSNKNKGLTLNLNESMLYMFYSLLTQSVLSADWNIGEQKDAHHQQNALH